VRGFLFGGEKPRVTLRSSSRHPVLQRGDEGVKFIAKNVLPFPTPSDAIERLRYRPCPRIEAYSFAAECRKRRYERLRQLRTTEYS